MSATTCVASLIRSRSFTSPCSRGLPQQGVKQRLVFRCPNSRTEPTQRADIRQMIIAAETEKPAIGDICFHLPKNLRVGEIVMILQQFELDQQHRLDPGTAEVDSVKRLDRLPELQEIDMFFGPPNPVVASDQRVKDIAVRPRKLRRRYALSTGFPPLV